MTEVLAKPEDAYHTETDKIVRRRLQGEVVTAYRSHVAALARKMVPTAFREEAEQVGLTALVLDALPRYEPGRGVPFWGYAALIVRDAIETWAGRGIYWRASTKRAPGRQVHTEHLNRRSLDAPVEMNSYDPGAGRPASRYEGSSVADDSPNPEQLVADAEAMALVEAELSRLPEEDRKLLLCEKRERSGAGIEAGNNARSRRYLSLVAEIKAAVRGNNADDRPRAALHGGRDSVRP